MAHDYVSTVCRTEDHASCQERPVVRCACACHEGRWPWVERRKTIDGGEANQPVRRRSDLTP